jgi:serine/threonine protein kinase
MENDNAGGQLATQDEINAYHRQHPFTLPTPGQQIISPATGARYMIGDKFGQGSFGDVFACSDEWGHDLVAKIIRPIGDFLQTEEKAFAEISALVLVRSPYIVHVHDAILYRGACYIISERCDQSLRQMIAGRQRKLHYWFPPLVKAILHALHFVHVQELAHCDVHAGNVFLRFIPDALLPEDHAASTFKLGDFGLARPVQNMDPRGTFLTSLRPPETLNPAFGPLDYRSDVYQAGLLFLSVLLGEEQTFTVEEILAGRPRELAEALPSPAAEVVARMLRRHVEHRPPTALNAWRDISPVLMTQ